MKKNNYYIVLVSFFALILLGCREEELNNLTVTSVKVLNKPANNESVV